VELGAAGETAVFAEALFVAHRARHRHGDDPNYYDQAGNQEREEQDAEVSHARSLTV